MDLWTPLLMAHMCVFVSFRVLATDVILGGPDKSKGNIVFRGSAFAPLLSSSAIKVPINNTACTWKAAAVLLSLASNAFMCVCLFSEPSWKPEVCLHSYILFITNFHHVLPPSPPTPRFVLFLICCFSMQAVIRGVGLCAWIVARCACASPFF